MDLHFDVTQVAVVVFNDSFVFLAIKHISQETSCLPRFPTSHGCLSWVHDRGHEGGRHMNDEHHPTDLRSSQGTHTLILLE